MANPLRAALLTASRNHAVRRVVENAPVSRSVVRRFVAGTDVEDAVRVSAELVGAGLAVAWNSGHWHAGELPADEVVVAEEERRLASEQRPQAAQLEHVVARAHGANPEGVA